METECAAEHETGLLSDDDLELVDAKDGQENAANRVEADVEDLHSKDFVLQHWR